MSHDLFYLITAFRKAILKHGEVCNNNGCHLYNYIKVGKLTGCLVLSGEISVHTYPTFIKL